MRPLIACLAYKSSAGKDDRAGTVNSIASHPTISYNLVLALWRSPLRCILGNVFQWRL